MPGTAWFGNRPDGLAEPLAAVDAACRDVGRDPAGVERTVAVMVATDRATGLRDFDRVAAPPLRGTAAELAEGLRGYARLGVTHVQLVIDPIDARAIESLGAVLELLDQAVEYRSDVAGAPRARVDVRDGRPLP